MRRCASRARLPGRGKRSFSCAARCVYGPWVARGRPITRLSMSDQYSIVYAKDPVMSPDDLPPREQLELFSESGQGARRTEQAMAKKSANQAKRAKKQPAAGDGGGGGAPPAAGGGGGAGAPGTPGTSDASLEAEARRRYLNYALSVITSRALPDVRD